MNSHSRWILDSVLKLHAQGQHGTFHSLVVLLLLLSAVSPLATGQPSDGPPPSGYPYDQVETNFNPSLTVIIVVLVCAFFFIAFFSVYIRHCADNADLSGRLVVPTTSLVRRLPRGLEPAVIDSFPIFAYSEVKEHKIGKGTLECAVCITEFVDDDELRLLSKCDHVFHTECIDTWLASHTTCPVCRTNLTPNEFSGENVPGELIASLTDENPQSEAAEVENQIQIDMEDNGTENSVDPAAAETPKLNRGAEAKKFPRSHTTGHSLVQPGENCERYTLRLPDDVRKRIVTLKRTTSFAVVLPREGSSRRGNSYYINRSSREGSSRGMSYQDRLFGRSDRVVKSDRWVFTSTPPFIARTSSVKVGSDGDAMGVGSSKRFMKSVKAPFDCLSGAKGDVVEPSRPPV